eukprot:3689857-Rhodomonas_salina.1
MEPGEGSSSRLLPALASGKYPGTGRKRTGSSKGAALVLLHETRELTATEHERGCDLVSEGVREKGAWASVSPRPMLTCLSVNELRVPGTRYPDLGDCYY